MQRRCNAAVVDFAGFITDRGETVIAVQSRTSRRGLEHRARGPAGRVAARRAPRGHPRRRRRRDARQERLDRLQPARQPVRRGRRRHHRAASTGSRPAFRDMVTSAAAAPADELHDLSGARLRPPGAHAQALLPRRRPRRRAATSCSSAALQGMPKLPGLEAAHRRQRARARARQGRARDGPARGRRALRCRPGLRRFTAHTITDPTPCATSCARSRRRGYAVEREEFDDDFCCIAAPVLDPRGRFLAVIGISMTRRAFDEEHETLAQTVVAVAAGGRRAAPARRPGRSPLSAYDIARFPGIFRNAGGS